MAILHFLEANEIKEVIEITEENLPMREVITTDHYKVVSERQLVSALRYLGNVFSNSEGTFDCKFTIDLCIAIILVTNDFLSLKMDGKLPFVETFKISMNLLPSQNILKGISAADVNLYLRWLAIRYESSGRKLSYVWKRIKKVDTNLNRYFNGWSVFKLLSGNTGRYVLFGKAKWNNDAHRKQLKKLKSIHNERTKFIVYAVTANGSKVPDHAVGLSIGFTASPILYDNSMRNVGASFDAEALASKMSDVSSCYVFDVREL